MSDQPAAGVPSRAIELSVEVPGTPEQVWRAVATGPGISSWYVPHQVEETEGGRAVASFGPEPEMQIPGRVAVWEPPRRIVFDGGDADAGLTFDWRVEPVGDDRCVVRLINGGFAADSEYDAWYDSMTEGWKLFLYNLQLHLEHFAGETATVMLPLATWSGRADRAWPALAEALGLPVEPVVGDRVEVSADDAPALAGTVMAATPRYLALVVDEPAPGTAFIAAEAQGDDNAQVSVWSYLYGPKGEAAVERDEPRWRTWLTAAGGGVADGDGDGVAGDEVAGGDGGGASGRSSDTGGQR